MTVSPAQAAAEITCNCPTCHAEQPWSDTCRRCQCDLSLLRHAAEAWAEQRRRCLAGLRAGLIDQALDAAGQCYAIWPNECSARLLAVCHLLNEDWPAALAIARGSRQDSG